MPPSQLVEVELLQGDQQTNYHTEERNALDEGSRQDHGTLDLARGFRLTGDSFGSRATDAADAHPGAHCDETCTDTGTHLSETR